MIGFIKNYLAEKKYMKEAVRFYNPIKDNTTGDIDDTKYIPLELRQEVRSLENRVVDLKRGFKSLKKIARKFGDEVKIVKKCRESQNGLILYMRFRGFPYTGVWKVIEYEKLDSDSG